MYDRSCLPLHGFPSVVYCNKPMDYVIIKSLGNVRTYVMWKTVTVHVLNNEKPRSFSKTKICWVASCDNKDSMKV